MGILCGVDIIEIDRIRKSYDGIGQSFIDKIFTRNEINYCEKRNAAKYQSYATRFAAKEAVSKALGTGIGNGIKWGDIEVLNNDHGKPYVILSNKAKELFNQINAADISLSLSHCKNYAVAYVIIQT